MVEAMQTKAYATVCFTTSVCAAAGLTECAFSRALNCGGWAEPC